MWYDLFIRNIFLILKILITLLVFDNFLYKSVHQKIMVDYSQHKPACKCLPVNQKIKFIGTGAWKDYWNNVTSMVSDYEVM